MLDFFPEDITENSADQHRHEDQKQQNEVLKWIERLMDFEFYVNSGHCHRQIIIGVKRHRRRARHEFVKQN